MANDTVVINNLFEFLREHRNIEDDEVLSITFNEDLLEFDDVVFYDGEPILPDDPTEGDEGYDDKMKY